MTNEQYNDIFMQSSNRKKQSYDEGYLRRLAIRLNVSYEGLREAEKKIRDQEKLNRIGECIGRHPAYFSQLFQQGRKGKIYNQLKDWLIYIMKDCNYVDFPAKSLSKLEVNEAEQIIIKTREELSKSNSIILTKDQKINALETQLTSLNVKDRRSDAYQAEIINLQNKLRQAKKEIADLKQASKSEVNLHEFENLKLINKRLEKLVDLLMEN